MEEGDVKRWHVTYTKHVKQKRKVYQDGFLELHTSTNKVMLYDECEKLMECRLLKKDEVICPGETLTFNAHLIDINEDVNFEKREKKVTEKPNMLRAQKFRTPSVSFDRKTNVEKNKARPTLSPSQKIIRDFKKSELQKYKSPQSSPDTKQPSLTEWQVLYTTQVTQKAKKYHDGFLQLATCGSLGRQVKLFDASRKLLDSRFLKKDEVIRSDESIAFAAHLVEIGERDVDCKPLMDNCQGNNCNADRKTGIMHGQQNCVNLDKPVGKEWQVLYTTQLTQKAKKYHDGFLRVAICGSLGRQVMLYDAFRKLLDSRFLKKDEVIRSGESIALDAHLVDIGEPEGDHEPLMDQIAQGNNCNVIQKSGIMCQQRDCDKDKKSVPKGTARNNASSGKDADSNFSISSVEVINRRVPTNNPLRDAHQILSILQKSRARESNVSGHTENNTLELALSTKEPRVSDAIILDIPDGQPPRASLSHHESSESMGIGKSSDNIDIEKSPDLMSYVEISSCHGSQLSKGVVDLGNSLQPYSDNVQANNKCYGASAFGISNSNDCASHGLINDARKSSKEHTCAREMKECPSFDLGF